ncbi:MAG: phosphoglucosamine mutase [Deltaproteobacteria bacterium RIFCSPLOWO2_12_FULL_40_28]|nr:MAG: phosphoglucosamine mutase [Deltaproteobacteria bacterium RIFCSPHIGHO2_02_FULL_40_28]OGQ20976.1 MAG: phosphoglucosamine mutase [Deltaproteobacteria bacterium RIFCSPHIGHO2_12_FULL_40_32]OGQ39377.1 MAG: phosphoglucosamine mutase [Deltaproteobacteria bacterium RIFCSPLOWO2_02_FULL_40_36]OGQ54658.1 MAG: phosphoglucosamine mutase [Deltaproteobacteria bacterium RIFCSPLOWO2_12_FULL_40_28]
MEKLFGTDGVRGRANRYPMTPEVALALGQAIAFHFARKQGFGRIVIGKDTRRSSYMFEYALSAGISSMGSIAVLTGPLPTPGIAFLTTAMRADAGVVISASHNGFSDNGIKFFDRDGFKLPDEIESQMQDFVFQAVDDSIRPTGADIGRAVRIDDAVGRYAEFLKSTFPRSLTLKGLKVVVDCAHGAAYHVAPLVLSEMDAEVVAINHDPNGVNINEKCGALHPEELCKKVKECNADLGIALDGDADRLILCDAKGRIINGDRVLAILAMERKSESRLYKDTVVGTIMSNMGLESYLHDQKINFVRTAVGDRYIVEEMRNKGYTVGGEPSGHLIMMDLSTTGDGLLAALQVLACMIKKSLPLEDLVNDMLVFPQKIKNISVKKQRDIQTDKVIQDELHQIEKDLGKGRVVIRYSGTEPLLRVMVEGESDDKVNQCIDRISECLQTHL